MPIAQKIFTTEQKSRLGALVQIARGLDPALIEQSISSGIYNSDSGSVRLIDAQTEILSRYPSLGTGLIPSANYNSNTFRDLINHFRMATAPGYGRLLDLINESLRLNDAGLLDRFSKLTPTKEAPEEVAMAKPPAKAAEIPTGPLSRQGEAVDSSRSEPLKRPVNERPEIYEPPEELPAEIEQEQEPQQERQEEQPLRQPERQIRPESPPQEEASPEEAQPAHPSQQPPATSPEEMPPSQPPSQPPPGKPPSPPTTPPPSSGDDEDKRKRRRWPRFLRPRSESGWGFPPGIPKFLQRWLGNLARGAARIAADLARMAAQALGRGLANILSRLALQAGLTAARTLLLAVLANPITWVVVGLITMFTFVWWYDQLIGNSECSKPFGEMRIVKRLGDIGSLEVDPNKIEPEVQNGEKINFIVEVSYQLACRSRTLPSVVVTDKVPEGLEYVRGSAKSGFYSTADIGPDGVYDETTRTLTWTFSNFPMSNPVFIYFSVDPIKLDDGSWEIQDTWVTNEAKVKYTETGTPTTLSPSSQQISFTGPSRGLMCVPGLDERLARVFEEAGVAANVSPSIVYAIAKAENGGSVTPHSLDGKLHPISPCGAHGLMQIQHINDGSGKNYAASCAAIGGSSNPPEVWNGLSQTYNEISGGNIVDADSDKDSIFGSAFYIKDNGWPGGKNYTDFLSDSDAARVAVRYLGAGNMGYIGQTVNSYKDAFARQGTCGGTGTEGGASQPIPEGVSAQ